MDATKGVKVALLFGTPDRVLNRYDLACAQSRVIDHLSCRLASRLPPHLPSLSMRILALAVLFILTSVNAWAEAPADIKTSEWEGFERKDFSVSGRAALLVSPKIPAKDKPWIWRTEFFGHEPQADKALLEKGYSVAYMDVQNMFGAPVALDLMDQFYDHLLSQYQLAPKVVLEGFSRGGLFALNWAARHPGRVASIYLDAPVCDFKSWPGGKGKGPGSPNNWVLCLRAYGLTEEQAMNYKLNPVDNLKPLADAKIPILSVCGDADLTVPFDENTKVIEERYKELGGEILVIAKPGVDHHPHSLVDPTPIVDFILKHR